MKAVTIARIFIGITIVGFLIAGLSLLGLGASTIDPFGAGYELPYLPMVLWEGAFPSIVFLGILGITLLSTLALYFRKLFVASIVIAIIGFVLTIPFARNSFYLWRITVNDGTNIEFIPSGANLATFRRLSDSAYFVDANHAYCWGDGIHTIAGADPSTAQISGDTLQVNVDGVVQTYKTDNNGQYDNSCIAQ